MLLFLLKALLVLVPVIWLMVAALAVGACRVAARGDGRRSPHEPSADPAR